MEPLSLISFIAGVAFWALVDLLIEGWHWRSERRKSCYWEVTQDPPDEVKRYEPGDIIEPKDVLYYGFYDETEHRN